MFITRTSLQAKQLIRSTISMFLIGWESQYNKTTPAMDNQWLAASSQQHAFSGIRSHAEFFVKHKSTQVTQPRYSPDLAPCDFWLFPKLKSPLKGKRFQTISEIQENTTRQLMVNSTKDFCRVFWMVGEMLGELCEVPRCLLWRGLRRHCPMSNVSCILYLLQ